MLKEKKRHNKIFNKWPLLSVAKWKIFQLKKDDKGFSLENAFKKKYLQ